MIAPLLESALPLPLWRRGKVREVYEVSGDRLLIVASDRVSAFDVVMNEAVPGKGRVLTQLSAHWFRSLSAVTPSHFITTDIDEIIGALPSLADHREQIAGREESVHIADRRGILDSHHARPIEGEGGEAELGHRAALPPRARRDAP